MTETSQKTEQQQLEALLEADWKQFAFGYPPEGWEHVADEEHDSGRWSTFMSTIVRGPSGQLYGFQWDRGLTEYQEHSCEWPDVRKVTAVTKTIVVTEYVEEGK